MNWKPLKLSASAAERLPPFLISSDFATDAYTIYLTDFTNTWYEKLDKDEILRRGIEEDTSIDPNEDEDQLQIFLEKIRFGLEGGKDTELSLGVGSATRAAAPELSLNVRVPLPGGMRDLEWAFRLVVQRQGDTAEKLVIPTIQLLHETRERSDKLIEMLEEKDVVIQKLVDSLERLGTDLGAVFHQVAGRPGRKVDRKKASERVKGLGPFDVQAWRRGLNHNEALGVSELLDSVFGEVDTVKLPSRTDVDKLQRCENWWKGMDGEMIQLFEDKSTATPNTPPRIAQEESTPAEEDEDEFQVQATPPHLSKTKQTFSMDDSTEDEDEDDLDAPSQRFQVPDSFPISQHREPSLPPRAPPKKLGKLGMKRKAPTPTPPPPAQEADDTATEDDEPMLSPAPKNVKDVTDNDNDNDTTEDEENDTPSLPSPKRQKTPQKSPTPPPPTKKKGKLGQIRSKKAASPPPPSPSPPHSPLPSESPPPSSQPLASQSQSQRPKGKLGKIGGRKKETTPEPDALPERIATPTKKRIGGIGRAKGETPAVEDNGKEAIVETETQREKTPPKMETEEEKADRKREELKKQLEAKAKAPAKKKRKF
ncbi:XLF family protein [Rutstroemia sp. NJR-2017a BVV2]|nr:XLF family protein [Rutstroemia sp. NJR-2017a BVV2]